MRIADPLSPLVYPRRRFARVLPGALVVLAVSALLVLVLTPTNTFEETTRANLRALEAFTVVSPATRPGFGPELEAALRARGEIDTMLSVRALWIRYPMLVGESFCAFVIAPAADVRLLASRTGLTLAAGRWPRDGAFEAVLQEDVARARGFRVGTRFGTLVDPDDTTPGRFEVVGLLRGAPRLAVGTPGDGPLAALLAARTPPFRVVFARPGAKPAMDRALRELRDGDERALRVIDAAEMRARLERALQNLPLLSGGITVVVALAAAIVVALLQLVAFQAREQECAMLLALGQPRGRLLRSVAGEVALLAALAWIAGAAAGWLLLATWVRGVLEPRGLLLRLTDAGPIAWSLVVPVSALLASVGVLAAQLHRMDPVARLQGRGR